MSIESVEIEVKGVAGVKTAVREDSGINHKQGYSWARYRVDFEDGSGWHDLIRSDNKDLDLESLDEQAFFCLNNFIEAKGNCKIDTIDVHGKLH